jgi:hypothetical protein
MECMYGRGLKGMKGPKNQKAAARIGRRPWSNFTGSCYRGRAGDIAVAIANRSRWLCAFSIMEIAFCN